MAKKRKPDATGVDEIDRMMYTTFCGAANSLSQLYSQALNQQKLSFQAGERHALEKLYHWISRRPDDGSRASTVDVLAYLQSELDCGGEEPLMSPRVPSQHQNPQADMHFLNSGAPVSSGTFGPTTIGQGPRSGCSDHQSRNLVFSNELSSHINTSLQHYHLTQDGYYSNNIMPSENGTRNTETHIPHHQTRDSNSHSSNDSSMDMHADSPAHESPY